MHKKKFILVFITFIVFIIYIYYKFDCIKNTLIDEETNTKIVYTKKQEINDLLLNNEKIFDEIIYELSKINDIEDCHLISIPFDNNIKNVKFYGLQNNPEISKNQKLYHNLKFLSSELKIYKIEILHVNEQKEMEVLFTQTWGINDTYIGLKYNKYNNNISINPNYEIAFTIKPGVVYSFEEPINNTNWSYYCSRDLDMNNYGFWQRLYDIFNGNLS